jgi:hypothetical protein
MKTITLTCIECDHEVMYSKIVRIIPHVLACVGWVFLVIYLVQRGM